MIQFPKNQSHTPEYEITKVANRVRISRKCCNLMYTKKFWISTENMHAYDGLLQQFVV